MNTRVTRFDNGSKHLDLDERDTLFRSHPQSALSNEQKAAFYRLRYYDYDPALRFLLPVDPIAGSEVLEVELDQSGLLWMRRFGKVRVPIVGQTPTLWLFWLLGYRGCARISRLGHLTTKT
jgi:uncharacterized protein